MSEKQINTDICERIKALIADGRHGKKVKIKDLANAIKVSPVHMSNIISGKKKLTDDNAERIAEYFDVRAEWILGKDKYKTMSEYMETIMFSDGWKDDYSAFKTVFNLTGYSIGLRKPIVKKLSIDARRAYAEETGEEAPEELEITPDGISISLNGERLLELPEKEYQDLRETIVRFAKFSISELIEKKGKVSDGE